MYINLQHPGRNPLRHDHHGDGWIIVGEGGAGLLQLRQLELLGKVQSSIADAISVDNDSVRELMVHLE